MQKVSNYNQNFVVSYNKPIPNCYSLKKEVIVFVLRHSLLESESGSFEIVERCLSEKYQCDVSDCVDRPECLLDVLKYVYESSYTDIINSIKLGFTNFKDDKAINEFLERLR